MAWTMVNGALLRNHLNQTVSVHVNVEQEAERNATLISGKTSDDMDIKVQLDEPLNVPVKGWIEVIGTPNGANSIQTKEIIIFSHEDSHEPFDKTAHNALITFLNNLTDIFDQPEFNPY